MDISNREHLDKEGYVVIPFADKEKLKTLQEEFDETLNSFIEYKSTSRCKKEGFVLGGFSALANPSSFHNNFVRRLREWCMAHLIDNLFRCYEQHYLEQIIDRMMYRPIGFTPSKESWHRDEAPNALKSDKTFGGWINLDSVNQFFSAVPRTHNEVKGLNGFVPIKDKKEKEKYNKNKIKIVIPPGHILVFYENMIHEVLSKKSKTPIKRVFLAWRLTKHSQTYFSNIDVLLRNQSVMPLKSLQIPPMYAKLHWTNWRTKIELFSDNIIDECKEKKTMKSGKDKGKSYYITQRHLSSLSDLKRNIKPYSRREIKLYKPNNEWILLKPFRKRLKQKYSI
jgi:hypothetical protein